MREAVWKANNDDRRQCLGLGKKDVIDRQHHLFRLQAETAGRVLEDIDGGPVDVGLAGFAKPAIMNRQAKSFEGTLEHGRTAIHSRSLYDLRHEESAPPWGIASHVSARAVPFNPDERFAPRNWPAARST